MPLIPDEEFRPFRGSFDLGADWLPGTGESEAPEPEPEEEPEDEWSRAYRERDERWDEIWQRASAGEVLLSEIPRGQRFSIRIHHALWWARDSRGRLRIGWPEGHQDHFLCRDDDEFMEPGAIIEYVPPDPSWEHLTDEEWDNGFRDDRVNTREAFWDLNPEPPRDYPLAEAFRVDLPPSDLDLDLLLNVQRICIAEDGFLYVEGSEEFDEGDPWIPPREEDVIPLAPFRRNPETSLHRLRGVIGLTDQRIGRGKIAAAPDGTLYQSADADIRRFDLDGALLHRWGKQGSRPGQFHGALGLDVHPDGSVFVADRFNCRIQRFTPEGDYIGGFGNGRIGRGCPHSWKSREARRRERPDPSLQTGHGWLCCGCIDAMDVAVTPDGSRIVVADLSNRAVSLEPLQPAAPAESGEYWSNAPYAVSVSPDGSTIYAVGNKGNNLFLYRPGGGSGFWSPPHPAMDYGGYEDVDAAPDGTVYLLEEWSGNVHVLAPDGELIETLQVGEDVELPPCPGCDPDDVRAAWRHRLNYTWPQLDRPSGVATLARDGRIVVAITMHSGEIMLLERDWWTGPGAFPPAG
jgi:hypothetical protein